MLLSITLIVMIMPASALGATAFPRDEPLSTSGQAWSVVLPFGFFPFGVYLSYIFFSSTIPKDLLAAAAGRRRQRMGRVPARCPATCRGP